MAECCLGVGFDVRLCQAPLMMILGRGSPTRTHGRGRVCAAQLLAGLVRTWEMSPNGASSTRPRGRFPAVGAIGMVDRPVRPSIDRPIDGSASAPPNPTHYPSAHHVVHTPTPTHPK